MLKAMRGCLIAIGVIVLMIGALLLVTQNARAQDARVCNPFTTTPDAGMLAVGTVVVFTDYRIGGMFTREGKIEAYYIASCWPASMALIPGLDGQAYVISYGSPDGSQVVLNRSRFEVK